MNPWDMDDAQLEEAFRAAKAGDAEVGVDTVEDVVDQVEDLEQPVDNVDSDDNTSTDNNVEDEVETDSETTDANLDGDADAEDEQPVDTEAKTEEEVQPVQKYKFKANGREYELTMDEIMDKFPTVFSQAMDYTKKTQEIKPWRKTIDALKSAQLTPEDVNLAIDVLKGDKAAISEVLKKHKMDALDIDVENSTYVAKDYGRDEKTLALNDVIEEIKTDNEYVITSRILSEKWDDRSFQEMTNDPELIKLLHIDVKNGMFEKVQPIADKLKVFDGGRQSDLEYYKAGAKEYFTSLERGRARLADAETMKSTQQVKTAEKAKIAQVRANERQVDEAKQKSALRKAAAVTKSVAGSAKRTNYLDDSDEAFDEWYSKLQERY